MPAPAPAIETHGLSRRFAAHYALRDISLTLPPGAVLLLVGPNGAGKTTLLRLLATALRPSRGRATVFGRDVVREADAVRERVALVGAAPAVYGALTPRENLAFVAAMSGRADDGPAVLERVGLADVADRPVRTLSHGMQRRLALGRAWVLRPHLLLLDEPFVALDAQGQPLVPALVDEVRAAGGAAVIATHEWERGLRLADAVVALAAGRQVEMAGADALSGPRLQALAGGRR